MENQTTGGHITKGAFLWIVAGAILATAFFAGTVVYLFMQDNAGDTKIIQHDDSGQAEVGTPDDISADSSSESGDGDVADARGGGPQDDLGDATDAIPPEDLGGGATDAIPPHEVVGGNITADATIGWEPYGNDVFGFSLSYPPQYAFCLTHACVKSAPDADIQYVQIWDPEQVGTIDRKLFEIRPSTEPSILSIISHGKKMQQHNATGGYYVPASGKAGSFKGLASYQFDVNGFLAEPGDQRLLRGAHRVTYFQHKGSIYRLIYPLQESNIDLVLATLEFYD